MLRERSSVDLNAFGLGPAQQIRAVRAKWQYPEGEPSNRGRGVWERLRWLPRAPSSYASGMTEEQALLMWNERQVRVACSKRAGDLRPCDLVEARGASGEVARRRAGRTSHAWR
jgi:hypothetical protein